jgi:hypothetical protein
MLLRSNIPAVKARLQRLQAGFPDVLAQAIAPAHWKPLLELIASKTLRAQWVGETDVQTRALYERLTPRIVATFMEKLLPNGVEYTLGIPDLLLSDVGLAAAAKFNLSTLTPTGRERKLSIKEVEAEAQLHSVRQTILDWVQLEKRRDERDAGLSDEQIAERIEHILGVGDRVIPRDRTPAMEEAALGLNRAIQSWLDGEGDSPPPQRAEVTKAAGLAPAVAQQWLYAVLLAWREYLRVHLPSRIAMKLADLNRRVAGHELL